MASAVTNPQNAFAKLEELQAKAKEVDEKFQNEKARLESAVAEAELARQKALAPLIADMKSCADSIGSGATNGVATSPQVASTNLPPAVKRKRGRPKGSGAKTVVAKKKAVTANQSGAPKRRGRPKGSTSKAKANEGGNGKAVVQAVTESMDLKDAILHVLEHPRLWRKHVPDLPRKADGLKVMELYQVIEGEGFWKTDAKNPEQQVSQRLADLREQNKVVRGDGMRYRLTQKQLVGAA